MSFVKSNVVKNIREKFDAKDFAAPKAFWKRTLKNSDICNKISDFP
jgi:hypothetical protein